MDEISTLQSAWIFDIKGNVKQVKNETDKARSKEIYQRAREALRYTRSAIGDAGFRRLSFVNQKQEWTITVTSDQEIIVMHKDESLA